MKHKLSEKEKDRALYKLDYYIKWWTSLAPHEKRRAIPGKFVSERIDIYNTLLARSHDIFFEQSTAAAQALFSGVKNNLMKKTVTLLLFFCSLFANSQTTAENKGIRMTFYGYSEGGYNISLQNLMGCEASPFLNWNSRNQDSAVKVPALTIVHIKITAPYQANSDLKVRLEQPCENGVPAGYISLNTFSVLGMPLQIERFDAHRDFNRTKIVYSVTNTDLGQTWKTEVERSIGDNNRWYRASTWHSSEGVHDEVPVLGFINYYRLKVTGSDGEIKYSRIAAVDFREESEAVNVINEAGQQVASGEVVNKTQVYRLLATLPPGTYFVVRSGGKTDKIRKQ